MCLLPEETTQFLKDHGLKQTLVESRGFHNNFKELKNCLIDLIFEVGNSPISKQDEGSVIYFVS